MSVKSHSLREVDNATQQSTTREEVGARLNAIFEKQPIKNNRQRSFSEVAPSPPSSIYLDSTGNVKKGNLMDYPVDAEQLRSLKRHGSEKSRLVGYFSSLKERTMSKQKQTAPPPPTVTVTDTSEKTEPAVVVQRTSSRRKTWPTSQGDPTKRKGFLNNEEEHDSVINIYFEHRDHLEQDFRARTDLDTQAPKEDLYIPNQELHASQSLPNTPLLITEFPTTPFSMTLDSPQPTILGGGIEELTRSLSFFLANNAPKVFPHLYYAGQENTASIDEVSDPFDTSIGYHSIGGQGIQTSPFMDVNFNRASVW